MNNEHISLYVSGCTFESNSALYGNGGVFYILNA